MKYETPSTYIGIAGIIRRECELEYTTLFPEDLWRLFKPPCTSVMLEDDKHRAWRRYKEIGHE